MSMVTTEIPNLRAQLSDVYRDYRNICMSRKYYECRRRSIHRFNLWYEIVLAFGTSSVVGSWAIWVDPAGAKVWIIIGAIVAVATIAKPILKLSDAIERLSTLAAKYAALQIDFEQLIFDLKSEGEFTDQLKKTYKETREKMKDLDVKGDSPPNAKLLKRCQGDVLREVPASSLWSPE